MASTTLSQLAYALALIGGILLIIFGILSLLGFGFDFGPLRFGWGFFVFEFGGIVMLICGIIAVIGAKKASTIVWAIVLIIVGIFGGGIGGLLVLIGGIIGLIVILTNS